MINILLDRKESPSILESNILYLLIGILLITIGSVVQSVEIYSGLFITEYILILLPILLYLKVKGYSIRKTLRLNSISLRQIVHVILIVLLSYPIAVFFNYIGIVFLSKYGQLLPSSVPIPTSSKEFILGVLIISITPGICEEIMFRGMLLKSYESLGKKKAIIYSAILFGIFHFNLQNLLGPIFLGIIFGLLVYKTNSILSSMVGHMTNNLIALLIGTISLHGEEMPLDIRIEIPDYIVIIGGIVMGIIALILGFVVYRLIESMPETEIREQNTSFDIPIGSFYSYSNSINKSRNMDVIEAFPLFLFIIIFIFFNYKYFFI